MDVIILSNSYSSNPMTNLEKIKSLKRKADELSQEYHENMEKLKFNERDLDFMTRKLSMLDNQLDKMKLRFVKLKNK
jgi:hypothetical protein